MIGTWDIPKHTHQEHSGLLEFVHQEAGPNPKGHSDQNVRRIMDSFPNPRDTDGNRPGARRPWGHPLWMLEDQPRGGYAGEGCMPGRH
jgi:hypothetical protein